MDEEGTGRDQAGGGWWVVAAYGLLAAATQTLWLTFAPITTGVAHRYGVSVSAIGWLSEIFPLLYVVLAVPAGALLDRWFRPVLAGGGALVAAGGVLRLGGDTFAFALAGQALVAIGQPVVMSAVSKLAGEYLPAPQRAAGISAGSAAGFLGMLIALLLGPALGVSHLTLLLQLEAALGVLSAAALVVALLRRGGISQERAGIEGGVARALWRLQPIRVLSTLAFLGFGAFVALSTWLQTLLHPDGISETTAGALLVGMILAGVAGCAVIPPIVQRLDAERGFMRAVVIVSCLGCVALGVLPSLPARTIAMIAIGVTLLPALPVILTIAERIAGPAAGTAGAIVWLAGNLGGLIVALIVQALVNEPLPAFLALAAIVLVGLPFTSRVQASLPGGLSEAVGTPVGQGAGAGVGE